jgi:hypothetical protein
MSFSFSLGEARVSRQWNLQYGNGQRKTRNLLPEAGFWNAQDPFGFPFGA